tara:strand:+ start:128 stop:808 length:681 start_codon:yes stop_codon:yes gene_type:complete
MSNELRYERKFVLEDYAINTLDDLDSFLPINFYEKYQPRRINSIYYDTENFQLADDHLNGLMRRFKIRIRYYGKIDKVSSPKLEIKSKFGLVGKKDIFKLSKIDLFKKNFCLSRLVKNLNINIPDLNLLFTLKPKIFISYKRQYCVSECTRFRYTLDNDICFKPVNENTIKNNLNKNMFLKYYPRVLELKYLKSAEIEANSLSRMLPARLTTHSKYCNALEFLGLL